jgi:hypothetical protein
VLRRPPTRRETIWAVLVIVAVALVTAYAVLYWTDWATAPVHSSVAVALMVVGILGLIVFVRATRADPPANLGLVDVERSARWPLRRELWAGRPGPVDLRRYAAGWATRTLNRSGQGAGQLWLAGWLLAQDMSYRTPPSEIWTWFSIALLAALVIVGCTTVYLRRPAGQVLDQLEHENTTGEVPAVR